MSKHTRLSTKRCRRLRKDQKSKTRGREICRREPLRLAFRIY